MTVKIAIMLILAGAFVFTLVYLKRKKSLNTPSNLKNSDIQPNLNKVDVPKVAPIKSDPSLVTDTTIVSKVAQSTELEPETHSGTLSESILKRHHLSNIRQMVMATTFPQPTDSALSRHYDEMIDAKAEDCLADETKMARLVADYDVYLGAELTTKKSPVAVVAKNNAESSEQEPVLKHNHLNNIRLMVAATTSSRPTDSALSRHYNEMIDAKAEDCLADEAKMARLLADYEAFQNLQSIEQSAVPEQATIIEQSETAIPEDSMLRRHYLTHLQANLEKIR